MNSLLKIKIPLASHSLDEIEIELRLFGAESNEYDRAIFSAT